MSYEDPVEQRSMLLDEIRNSAYRTALKSVITPESVVMDVGAGVGILGLMAAELGAKKVYLIEPATDLEVARQVAVANGLQDKIEFVPEKIESARLPEKADVILSVFTGNFLLEEDLLPSLFLARDQYLKPAGKLIPDIAKMVLMPVSMPEYYSSHISVWDKPLQSIDFTTLKRLAANHLVYDHFQDHTFTALAEPADLLTMDLSTASEAACDARVEIQVTHGGELHGFLGWFDMSLNAQWLSTGPSAGKTHWRQAYLPIESPLKVTPGDSIALQLNRPRNGEWSWRIEFGETKQQYSTFLSRPVRGDRIALVAPASKPGLSDKGSLTDLVLSKMDGEHTLQEIAELVLARDQGSIDIQDAMLFVKTIVERYGK